MSRELFRYDREHHLQTPDIDPPASRTRHAQLSGRKSAAKEYNSKSGEGKHLSLTAKDIEKNEGSPAVKRESSHQPRRAVPNQGAALGPKTPAKETPPIRSSQRPNAVKRPAVTTRMGREVRPTSRADAFTASTARKASSSKGIDSRDQSYSATPSKSRDSRDQSRSATPNKSRDPKDQKRTAGKRVSISPYSPRESPTPGTWIAEPSNSMDLRERKFPEVPRASRSPAGPRDPKASILWTAEPSKPIDPRDQKRTASPRTSTCPFRPSQPSAPRAASAEPCKSSEPRVQERPAGPRTSDIPLGPRQLSAFRTWTAERSNLTDPRGQERAPSPRAPTNPSGPREPSTSTAPLPTNSLDRNAYPTHGRAITPNIPISFGIFLHPLQEENLKNGLDRCFPLTREYVEEQLAILRTSHSFAAVQPHLSLEILIMMNHSVPHPEIFERTRVATEIMGRWKELLQDSLWPIVDDEELTLMDQLPDLFNPLPFPSDMEEGKLEDIPGKDEKEFDVDQFFAK